MNSNILTITRETEPTTDIVFDYMSYLASDPITLVRLQQEDMIEDVVVEISNDVAKDKITLLSEDKNFLINTNTKTWYRRGDLSYIFPLSKDGLNPKLGDYLKDEWFIVKDFIHESITVLGGYNEETQDNKLKDLYTARNCGIKIPDTLVTTSKEKLLAFYDKHNIVLTKPIHNGHLSFIDNNKEYVGKGLVIIDDSIIKFTTSQFCLSLFQNYVDKEYEIRVFFIDKQLFPMVIFSQLDKKTKYDFRNYNHDKPNRNVPYNLPQEIKNKLLCFIKNSNLSTGSIDLIFSTKKEYVFLEVNPAGQFGWVSVNCNYYLEKKIATYLLNFQK